MRHHHEEGRGPRGRHGDPSEHGDHGRRGGGRRQRFFGHGELRLIILDILSRSASHGYELITEEYWDATDKSVGANPLFNWTNYQLWRQGVSTPRSRTKSPPAKASSSNQPEKSLISPARR